MAKNFTPLLDRLIPTVYFEIVIPLIVIRFGERPSASNADDSVFHNVFGSLGWRVPRIRIGIWATFDA